MENLINNTIWVQDEFTRPKLHVIFDPSNYILYVHSNPNYANYCTTTSLQYAKAHTKLHWSCKEISLNHGGKNKFEDSTYIIYICLCWALAMANLGH